MAAWAPLPDVGLSDRGRHEAAVVGHGAETVQERVSFYYLCDEVAGTHRGLEVMEDYWARKYAHLKPARLARELIRLAKLVQLSRYRKHKRGPKKPVAKLNKKRRTHVSTARVLATRFGNTIHTST
jgi:hypothetical protein